MSDIPDLVIVIGCVAVVGLLALAGFVWFCITILDASVTKEDRLFEDSDYDN